MVFQKIALLVGIILIVIAAVLLIGNLGANAFPVVFPEQEEKVASFEQIIKAAMQSVFVRITTVAKVRVQSFASIGLVWA